MGRQVVSIAHPGFERSIEGGERGVQQYRIQPKEGRKGLRALSEALVGPWGSLLARGEPAERLAEARNNVFSISGETVSQKPQLPLSFKKHQYSTLERNNNIAGRLTFDKVLILHRAVNPLINTFSNG